MTRYITQTIFFLTLTCFFMTSILVPVANASIIGTHSYLQSHDDSDRAKIESFLSREDVQNQLVRLGVSPDDARKRVAALTENELSRLQHHIDEMPAGSGALAVLGVVLIVLIVLELVGVTNIFTRL